MLAGLALGFAAGFLSPILAAVLIYLRFASPPRRRSRKQRRARPCPARPNA